MKIIDWPESYYEKFKTENIDAKASDLSIKGLKIKLKQ